MNAKKKTVSFPPVGQEEADRFSTLCAEALLSPRKEGEDGIGTLQEKRLHAVIKRYLCADETCHEVRVGNTRYVADVLAEDRVLEVQTGGFYPMRSKIGYYLEQTELRVTVVHPIPVEKWVLCLDPQTGETTPRRRSPKRGRPIDLLPKLASLSPYLQHPRFGVRLLLLETQDIRLHDSRAAGGRGRRGRLYERLPLALLGELSLCAPEDYRIFLPEELPARFTVKDFSRLTALRGRDAYSAVHTLLALGLLLPSDEPIGRSRAFLRADREAPETAENDR